MYERQKDIPYVISVTRNEALFLDDCLTLMVETTPDTQNIRPLRPISPITSGGVPAPMELIHKIGKAVLYTCDLENRNKEYKLYVEEFELLVLREVCSSTAKFGAELVGFNLKKKIYHALLKEDLEMEQRINEALFNMDKSFELSLDAKEPPKFKVNIKNVDELIKHINEELKLDEDSK
tara:strand:+ start:4656 stop:5192 length:537 start_codon:yes stop_codon:yes gene_type:complete